MSISFGKYIPVRVFVNKSEVRDKKVIQDVTLRLCDNLSKYKTSDNSYLNEQQRRYFASMVNDYKLPKKITDNKKEILPSSVVAGNIDGQRYLITGNDIEIYKEQGHLFGSGLKEIDDDPILKSDGLSDKDYRHIKNEVRKGLSKDRTDALKNQVKANRLNKTLYIHALTDKETKQKNDYTIALIDFKA